MMEELNKRQIRYLREQERKGRERWEAMDEDRRAMTKVVFWDWFLNRLERTKYAFSAETTLNDAHVKARNLGVLYDPGFGTTWAEVELHIREKTDELEDNDE